VEAADQRHPAAPSRGGSGYPRRAGARDRPGASRLTDASPLQSGGRATAGQLAAVVLIALIPRVIAAVALGDGFHFADEAEYADGAGSLLSGDGLGDAYRRVPGYPVLLALLSLPAPASVLWLRLAQALVTAFGAALAFLAADRLLGRAAGLATAAIYALDPLLVVAGALLYPEAVAAVLLLLAVHLTWESARRDSAVLAALAGLSLGLLTTFRPVALAVVPVVAAWVLFAAAGPAKRRAFQAGLVAVVCLLVLAPWAYRGTGVLKPSGAASFPGTSGAVTPAEIAQRGLAGALAHKAGAEPLAFASRIAREFGHFWELVPSRLTTDDPGRREALRQADPRLAARPAFSRSLRDSVSAGSFGLELLLALAGIVLLWRARRREAVLLAGVVLVYAVAQSLFFGKLRYRITVLPLVFVPAGAAASALFSTVRRRLSPRKG
jgi:4-amino-4-deoxy-L-arabinose transferase-like glycosyltransferase